MSITPILEGLSSTYVTFKDMFELYFSDMDLIDYKKKLIMSNPKDKNSYLKAIDEIRSGKNSAIITLSNGETLDITSSNIVEK